MTALIGLPRDELIETRLAVYRFLAAAFAAPTAEQHAWFASGPFRANLERLSACFAAPAPIGELAAADPADHEARYIACFEVGLPQPPVVLLASHYQRREPVTAIIHEHVLFYRRFGAHLAEGNREAADHLVNELAFLILLDEMLARGMPAASLLVARRDFLERHLARWSPVAAADAVKNGLPIVYRALLAILAAAAANDLELTRSMLKEAA